MTGCIGGGKTPKPNGKSKNEYDISQNIELSAVVGKTVTFENVEFTINKYFSNLHLMGAAPNYHDLAVLEINNKNKSKSLDIVDIYYASLDGEQTVNTLKDPVSCKYGKSKFEFELGESFAKYDTHPNVQIDGPLELRVITEGANITFHLFLDYVYDVTSNGKKVTDYDLTNHKNFYSSYDTKNKKISKASRLSGCWIGNKMLIDFGNSNEFDVVDIYFTDEEGGNRLNILQAPFSVNVNSIIEILVDDAPVEYYEKYNQKVMLHVVTDTENIICCSWGVISGETLISK